MSINYFLCTTFVVSTCWPAIEVIRSESGGRYLGALVSDAHGMSIMVDDFKDVLLTHCYAVVSFPTPSLSLSRIWSVALSESPSRSCRCRRAMAIVLFSATISTGARHRR